MRTSKKSLGLGRALITAAVLAAFGTAYAQDDDLAKLTQLERSVGVGASAVSGDQGDRSIFGQYNGMREDRGYLNLDIDYITRDDATGTWTKVQGRNLGLDSRDLSFTLHKQGDWKFTGDYSELVHREIRTVNTGMLGVGTTTPSVVQLATPGSGTDQHLQLKRTGLGLGGEKWINSALQLQVSFKNEDKDGTRFWGRGYDCAGTVCLGQAGTATTTTRQRWAVLFMPEAVDSNTKQVEAKLNFHTDKLFLSGGYYGSFFTNSNGNVRFASVPGSLNNPFAPNSPNFGTAPLSGAAAGGTSLQDVLQLPMALQPDNQAHQLYVAGNYRFTPKTTANFKLAYTRATQNQSFAAMGLADGTQPRGDLGGQLDSTLAQVGVVTHPMAKLTVNANLRYEKKDDKTPIAVYNTEGGTLWSNGHLTNDKTNGKLEASYLLPGNVRGTLGIDYEQINRELPLAEPVVGSGGVLLAGFNGLRGETTEVGYRAELRRSISDTLIGAVGYTHSKRDGSDWYNLCTNAACTTAGLVYGGLYPGSTLSAATLNTGAYPFTLSDRTRDKVRLSADWSASERLSVQFVAEGGDDKYEPPSSAGLQKSKLSLYSVDASYAVSERWKVNGYVSQGEQTINTGQNTGYRAELKDNNTAIGIGLTGKPNGRLEVGAKLSYIDDVNKYGLNPYVPASGIPNAALAAQAAVGLPDVTYRETKLNLYGKYALQKNADIRVDLIHFRAKLNEWAWGYAGVPFTYQDNTTVSINPDQRVSLVGVTYIYKFK